MTGDEGTMHDLVDSHCHLNLMEAQGGDLEEVLASAREQGVGHMLCAGIDLASHATLLAYVDRYCGVSASVGVHPNHQEGPEPSEDDLVALASDARIVAVGETGLDYYRSTGELEWQRERFRRHIAAAKRVRKPLIIHSREARDATLAILAEEGADAVGGVMHCFVEDWNAACRAMDLGFYISFSGIVTFKNARDLKDVARRVPLDRLLVETDSPYLAPVPYRGKPNQPAYVRYVAEHIAELIDRPAAEIGEATTRNFFTLFATAAA